MKKTISILAIAVLMVSMMSVNAFARGGCCGGQSGYSGYSGQGGYRASQQSDYAVCPVESCAELGLHAHDGTYYYCRNHGTGYGCGRNNCLR